MHNPPATEGNFCDEHGNALKPQIVQDYNQHMDYTDKGDSLTNSFSIQQQTWKWTKKLLFHLLNMIIMNSFLLPTPCGTKTKHSNFRLALVQNFIENAWSLPHFRCPIGRPAAAEKKVTQLKVNFSNHWPIHSSKVNCCTCSTQGI
jgi:hypothetical protein